MASDSFVAVHHRARYPRLSPETISNLPESVRTPSSKPSDHGVGIVHIGVGAFHRAHQAVYTDSALARHGGDWRIAGVSLRSHTAAEQLNPQTGLYSVASKDDDGVTYRVIGAIDRVIAAAGSCREALEHMARETTNIVSLTITEKGYCRDAATGHLNCEHPGIRADLQSPENPGTAIGCLVAALDRRFHSGVAPFSVLSCDNLPSNGLAVKQMVLDYAELLDNRLAGWIQRNAAFPSTMVDRICPATTGEDRRAGAEEMGIEDRGLIVAEPFSQWIIEDHFVNGRPEWQAGGAQFAADVTAYETAKLRILNGSHSAMAYIGCLCGIEFIHHVIGRSDLASFIHCLMDELETTLALPKEFDIQQYRTDLIARFRNSSLGHRTAQVAMDGSQKLPVRLIAPALERLGSGHKIRALSMAIAMWIQFTTGLDNSGRRRALDDPLREVLQNWPSSGEHNINEVVETALRLEAVFGYEAVHNAPLRSAIAASLESIIRHGPQGAIRRFLANRADVQ